MSNHIKINGVCVGMTKSEAWDLLQPLHVYKCEPMSISTIGTTSFAGAQVSITYLFDSSFVINKIHILWTKKEFREGSLIGKVSKNDLGSVYASFTNYFDAILPAKERGAKIYSKDATYMDLYNHVYVSKQDARDEGNPKFECVLVQLTDFIDHLDKDDKDKVRYARNLFIHTRENNIKEKLAQPNMTHVSKGFVSNNWFKIAIVIALLFIGLLYVQNNRYYYTNNGKVRVDKWKSEWTRINNNGEYQKP